jgi:hypothetical protein
VNPPELLAALAPVVRVLEELDVRHFVGGSVASSAHGVARASLDVDLVAELQASHVERFVERLQPEYYVDEARVRDSVASRRSFNLIHLSTMLKVDVFVSKGRPFDSEAMARARPEALDEGAASRRFFVASLEDIVLAKLEWFRLGGEVSERQWSDVVGVLKTAGSAADLVYLRRWGTALGVADLLERALEEAGS